MAVSVWRMASACGPCRASSAYRELELTTLASPPRSFARRGDPLVVLHDVAGIDDQQEVRLRHPVHQDVVHERAGRRRQRRILNLADAQPRGVVARHPLDGGQRVGAGHLDLAHVADVEQAGPRAHGHVLVDDAGVLDGHVPAAELDHPGAAGAVPRVERSFLERNLGRRHCVGWIRPPARTRGQKNRPTTYYRPPVRSR